MKDYRIATLETQIINSTLEHSRDIAKLRQELVNMETRELSVQVRSVRLPCLYSVFVLLVVRSVGE